MTIGGLVAIGFLLVMVVLVLRGTRDHSRSGSSSDHSDGSYAGSEGESAGGGD